MCHTRTIRTLYHAGAWTKVCWDEIINCPQTPPRKGISRKEFSPKKNLFVTFEESGIYLELSHYCTDNLKFCCVRVVLYRYEVSLVKIFQVRVYCKVNLYHISYVPLLVPVRTVVIQCTVLGTWDITVLILLFKVEDWATPSSSRWLACFLRLILRNNGDTAGFTVLCTTESEGEFLP